MNPFILAVEAGPREFLVEEDAEAFVSLKAAVVPVRIVTVIVAEVAGRSPDATTKPPH